MYLAFMKKANVKINLELGKALRDRLERDANGACRKLSWQALYYIHLSLQKGELVFNPSETLDDNDGRFTAYIPESMYDTLQSMCEEYNSNMSAVIRASILQGMALCRDNK